MIKMLVSLLVVLTPNAHSWFRTGVHVGPDVLVVRPRENARHEPADTLEYPFFAVNILVPNDHPNPCISYVIFWNADHLLDNSRRRKVVIPKRAIDSVCDKGFCARASYGVTDFQTMKDQRRCPDVAEGHEVDGGVFFEGKVEPWLSIPVHRDIVTEVSANLSFADHPGNFDGAPSRAISLSGEGKRPNQETGAEADEDSRYQRVQSHSLRSFVHFLRSRVHTFLGDKVVFLALAGFIFAALSGLGGFIVFDDPNREPKRLLIGRVLLFGGTILAGFAFLLGLP